MQRLGLTLFELMIVLAILFVLGMMVLPAISGYAAQSREDATRQSLAAIRDVLMGTYLDDMGEYPRPGAPSLAAGRIDSPQLVFLFVDPATFEDNDPLTADYDTTFDPVTRRGWRGPYLHDKGPGFRYAVDADRPSPGEFTRLYGETGDPAVLDGWGNPIVLQEPDANSDGQIDFDESRHARLVSAGENGLIDTPPDELSPPERGDDLVVFLRIAAP